MEHTEKSYQGFKTSSGRSLIGNDRSYLNDTIFGSDIEGKDVLDIGSSQGYFCVEALKRGAKRAVGIEPLPDNVKTAKEIASDERVPAEYVETDFENWATDEKFDVVLCLNVLHHMYDPIHVLQRMVELTRDKIIIEFSAPRLRDVLNKRIGLMAYLAKEEPLLVMGKPRHPKDSVRVAEYTYMFTPAALRTFFNTYYSCFSQITIKKSPFKGRYIAIAQKRKIKNLTIVAGPTSSGKSTFIDKLTESAELRKEAGIPDKIDMTASYRLYQSPSNEPLDHVVMHYDILRPFRRAIRNHHRDPVLSVIDSAENVTVLNIKTKPDQLIQQIIKGEPADSPRHQEIKRLYADPKFLSRWYGAWDTFVSNIPHARVLNVLNDGTFQIEDARSK